MGTRLIPELVKDIFQDVYKTLRLQNDLTLTVAQCIALMERVMKIVEEHDDLTGAQKKQVVLGVLELAYETFGGDSAVTEFVMAIASFMIDELIAVYNAGKTWMKSPNRKRCFLLC
jgi:hypothetical protein